MIIRNYSRPAIVKQINRSSASLTFRYFSSPYFDLTFYLGNSVLEMLKDGEGREWVAFYRNKRFVNISY